MIRGYPDRASVAPGEKLVLHVSTDAPHFRVSFYRWGDGFVPMWTSRWFPGEHAPAESPGDAEEKVNLTAKDAKEERANHLNSTYFAVVAFLCVLRVLRG